MIPLRDNNPRRTFPFVTYLLIALNILGFLWEVSLGSDLEAAIVSFGFIPARFWIPGHWLSDLLTIVASMFLHGSLMHIGSNMLYLGIFGDNVEDRLGHGRYLLFYLLCGFAATFAHAIFSASSRLPSIGASGAIAGVLGAYLVLYPHARVLTLIPLFFIFVRELPAVVLLGVWFILQLFSGVGSLGVRDAQDMGGVAYFAHIGGFVAGMILIALFGGLRRTPRRREPAMPWWYER